MNIDSVYCDRWASVTCMLLRTMVYSLRNRTMAAMRQKSVERFWTVRDDVEDVDYGFVNGVNNAL